MKKKFTRLLKKELNLPLAIYVLEKDVQEVQHQGDNLRKYEKAQKINAEGYELVNFYKAISKF